MESEKISTFGVHLKKAYVCSDRVKESRGGAGKRSEKL
jgi:hypothetical protein